MNSKLIKLLLSAIILVFSFKALSQNSNKYEFQVEAGIATGLGESTNMHYLSLSPGYRINKQIVIGAGLSYENLNEDHLLLDQEELLYKDTGRRSFWVPFSHVKYSFLPTCKISSYIQGRIGYGIFAEKRIPEKYERLIFYHAKGGVNSSVRFGFSYPLMSETRILLAVSYNYQRLTNRYLETPWKYSQTQDNSSVGLNIGILF